MPAVEQTPDSHATDARSRWKRWRRPLIEALLVLAVLFVVRKVQARTLASGVAPSVLARTLDGGEVRLGAEARAPHVLWFFATWCSVCRASEHNLRAFAGERDVVLVASESGTDEALLRFVREHGLTGLRVVNDRDGAIARRFGVRSFPTTFAVAATGQIRATDIGYSTELGLRWRRFWARH